MTQPHDAAPAKNDIRTLDEAQVARLEQSFRSWMDASRRRADYASRRRLWLIFLLLRSTGARLGEVLGMDPTRDLDLEGERPVALFGRGGNGGPNGAGREVPLPADVARALREALADPTLAADPSRLFDMDQGHVRRKFYERAEAAGLPRELASPSVLRRSRARQLMRQDVPLPVVQRLLGQSSADLTAAFSDYTDDEAGRIVEEYLKREERRKSSARNRFFGAVSGVVCGPVVASVEITSLGGFTVTSVVTRESVERLGIKPGVLATADIKAPWVQLSAGEAEPNSTAANRYPAVVRRILTGEGQGDPVSAEVVAELSDGTMLAAVITLESVRRLDLSVGSPVWASFGAFSVILNFG
ncbi:MAG: TOBE domain-containing protein [Desulfovibrio sp.]|jgi:molybdate transport system regulatory protein|nr:TOBE domain-containing protein [Desulfovibrio sp.]